MPRTTARLRPILAVGAALAMSLGIALIETPAQAMPAPDSGMVAPTLRVIEHRPAAGTVAYNQWYARRVMAQTHGWGAHEFGCLAPMWVGESHWQRTEVTGRYLGIPQTTVGVIRDYGFTESEYRESAEVQIRVGLRYIDERYGSPCEAWSFWKAQGAWQDSADPEQWWGGWY